MPSTEFANPDAALEQFAAARGHGSSLHFSIAHVWPPGEIHPCEPSGFVERRFKDGDVLLDGAAAHADACNQLALLGKWRSAAH